MMRKSLQFFLLFVGLTNVLGVCAVGQTVQGVITGTVKDPSGAVVPNASVTITNVGTSISQKTTTGAGGAYRFPLVPPGTYAIEVTAAGFATEKATGVVVQASQIVPFEFKLQVAQSSQVVEVSGESQLVQTATSDLSLQIDQSTIQNAALVDRDVFTSLPFLAPSVSPGMDLTPTSGGARESGTSYLLNGGEDNDNFGEGGANIHPPLESVDNFSIITNDMSAEYGRGMGAVVSGNQKSGGNKFHAVVYEFNRNALLNANDFFYNRDRAADQTLAKRPKYIKNQFGGEVDGPIIRDKTFFSFAYDRNKLLSGSTSANNYVPTTAALAYLTANGGALAQAVIAADPPTTSDTACPNIEGTGAGLQSNGLPNAVGCLSFFDPITDTQDAYYGRVDQNFAGKDRLSIVANVYRELNVDKYGGSGLTTKGAVSGTTTNHFHNLALSDIHPFSSRLLNEVSVVHNRHYNVFQEGNGTADTIPEIYIDNQNEGGLGYAIGGDYEGGQVEAFTQDRWQVQDNLTWTLGTHSLKIGGGGSYGIFYRNWDLGLPGYYEFGELTSVTGKCPACSVITPASDGTQQSDGTIANIQSEANANFAGDYPYYQETSIDPATGQQANAYRHYTYHDYYWFVQDDWKVSPRLTLNLGLRWDRYGAPSEVHNIVAQLTNFDCSILDASCIAGLRVGPVKRMWTTQNSDFGPRVGFAFDPRGDGKMAVRAGYGIAYDRIFDNIWSNGAWNPPYYALADFEADAGDAIYYSSPASIGAAYNPTGPCGQIPYPSSDGCVGKRVSIRTMDVHMKDSYGQNFYLGVERQIPGNMLLRVNYQGSLGRHLPMLENLNREDGIGANSSLTPVRPNQLYTAFNYRSNSVSSSYNALVVEAQKRMSNGLQFQTSYTKSKMLDVNSELFAGCSTIGGSSAPAYYTSNARPSLEYGRSSFDHRDSVKFNVIYELPFMKHEKGFLGQAFGGWHAGTLFQMYSGHPIDVWDGRTRYIAKDSDGNAVLDPSGVPYNLGGDYNLDLVTNDRPNFVGTNPNSVYSNATPAKGIFKDNNPIGCGASWVPSTVANVDACNSRFGATTPSTLFVTPNYPASSATYERFGALGRNVFTGPRSIQWDQSLNKTFKLAEGSTLDVRVQAQNLFNHPNFDCVQGNVSSGAFGQASCLTPFGTGEPKSRVMSLGARLAF